MHGVPRHFLSRGTTGSRGTIETGPEAAKPAAGRAGHCLYARRKGERGSAILESFLAMILLGMILFGILQLFQLALADMVTDYAAFRGARSAAVGFNDYYCEREVRVQAAPVSGPLIAPNQNNYPDWNRTETEKSLLRDYMNARPRRIEYEYWNGGETIYHTNYHCPLYGQPMLTDCEICPHSHKTRIRLSGPGNAEGKEVDVSMRFINYPLDIPLHDWLTGRDSIDISGEASLTNHATAFLE